VIAQVIINVIELFLAFCVDRNGNRQKISVPAFRRLYSVRCNLSNVAFDQANGSVTERRISPPHHLDRKTAWKLKQFVWF
jgi:hypothetical protein